MKHPYIYKEKRTPIQYIKQRIKETENYYGAGSLKAMTKALEIAMGGLQISDGRFRDIAELLGYKDEYYSIFEQGDNK